MKKLGIALQVVVLGFVFTGATYSYGQSAVNDIVCGSLTNGFGPFDYRTGKQDLPVVELHHFTPEVANLVRGKTGVTPGGDIDYTLRAFPNHPPALMAMIRLGEKEGRDKAKGARYRVECYLYRAWRFREDDPTVRMIYATYLAKHGRNLEALAHLEDAHSMGDDSANLNYNMGLIYFELKKYDKSLEYAHKAYAKGFPLGGLKRKLEKASKWQDSVLPMGGENIEKSEGNN